MGQAAGIRNTLRKVIDNQGKTCSLYSYADATKTSDPRGDDTITSWGTATSIKGISLNNMKYARLLANMGLESNEGDRGLFVKDNVAISAKDKIVIGTSAYEVISIKNYDPIEDDTILAIKIILAKNERYEV